MHYYDQIIETIDYYTEKMITATVDGQYVAVMEMMDILRRFGVATDDLDQLRDKAAKAVSQTFVTAVGESTQAVLKRRAQEAIADLAGAVVAKAVEALGW